MSHHTYDMGAIPSLYSYACVVANALCYEFRHPAVRCSTLHVEVGHGDAGDGWCLAAQQELDGQQQTDAASDDTLHDEAANLEVQPLGDETAQNLTTGRPGHHHKT